MSFQGTIETVSIPDVFSLCCQLRKSGELTLVTEVSERSFVFSNGNLASATTRTPSRRLGNYLMRVAGLTQLDVDQASECESTAELRFGRALVEKQRVTGEQLRAALHAQIIDIFREVLTWKTGAFHFDERALPADFTAGALISTQSLLLEAARISDEDEHVGGFGGDGDLFAPAASKDPSAKVEVEFENFLELMDPGRSGGPRGAGQREEKSQTASGAASESSGRRGAPTIPELRCLPIAPDTPGRLFTLFGTEEPERFVCETLAREPMLVAKVLKTAGLFNVELRRSSLALDKLVEQIGSFELRSILMPESVRGLFYPQHQCYVASAWQHSTATAKVCQELAVECQYVFPAEAHLAGLLHNLGVFVLLGYDAAKYRELIAESNSRDRDLEELEFKAFGFTHGQVGGFYAEHWKFPRLLLAAIKQHHKVDSTVSNPLVHMVVVADELVRGDFGYRLGYIKGSREQYERSLARLKLDEQRVEKIRRRMLELACTAIPVAVMHA